MAAKKAAKRLGKKHRQASTRPHKGKAPKAGATTGATRIGAVDPKKRKELAAKRAQMAEAKRISRRSPEFEAKRTIAGDAKEKPVRRAPVAPTREESQKPAPGRAFRADSERQAAAERAGQGRQPPPRTHLLRPARRR